MVLQREAEVYFSAAFNTATCRHLALLYDVAAVCNDDDDLEPLLVLQWADGPCSTLREWLAQHPDPCANLQDRLSFAVQMCAGLRELHQSGSSIRVSHADSIAGAPAITSPGEISTSPFFITTLSLITCCSLETTSAVL